MKYKQELLDCYQREYIIKKLKAIISFIEDKEKKYNKEIYEFTEEEMKECMVNDVEGYHVILDNIETNKEEIYYYINYYFELVEGLEK